MRNKLEIFFLNKNKILINEMCLLLLRDIRFEVPTGNLMLLIQGSLFQNNKTAKMMIIIWQKSR